MIKVMLVDDEIAIREGIRNSFPWEENGYTLVGEAPDGEIALPIIRDENPDVLITDIRMPFMDGLQLCREVRASMSWIGIVILSGYDDFSYARQAISLGVQEYLLKPITQKELLEVLDRISARIMEQRRARENAESLRRRLLSGDRFVKDKLLSSLFTDDQTPQESTRMVEQMRTMGTNLLAACYAVEDIIYTAEENTQERCQDAIYTLAEGSSGGAQTCSFRHGMHVLIMGSSEADTEERAYAFARSAQYTLKSMNAQNVFIAIGEMVTKLSDILRSVQSARSIRHRFSGGEREIVGDREMEDTRTELPDLNLRPLYERLQYAKKSELPEIIRQYQQSLGAADIHSTVADDYLRVEAVLTANRIVREAGGEPNEVLGRVLHGEGLLQAQGEMEGDVFRILETALSFRDANSPEVHSPVAQARAYLAEHYTDPNLMLQDVARAVLMSNSRLSTVFAQETGVTFTEYLTALRMGKAKELLSLTDIRSTQIALMVGYNDPHYFSYLFKKTAGMTPGEYRRSQKENQPE